MKRIICCLLLLTIVVTFVSCSANVNKLIENGQYEDALAIIEEDPDKYSDLYDEVRYKVAETAFKNDAKLMTFFIKKKIRDLLAHMH